MIVTLSGKRVSKNICKQSIEHGGVILKRGSSAQIFVDCLFLLRAGAHISISLLSVSSFLQSWLVFHGVEKLASHHL